VTDQLETLFREVRADTMREIRPPGIRAARRTVAVRRRRRLILITAVAVLAVVGGAAGLVPRSHREQAVSGPLPVDRLDRLAALAHQRVAAADPGTPAIDVQAPVRVTFARDSSPYAGGLSLSLACAGAGSITLVVQSTAGSEGNYAKQELTRVVAPCAADPVPVSATFSAGQARNLNFSLVDSEGAAYQAGFAFRVTSDTGEPMAPDDSRLDATEALDPSHGTNGVIGLAGEGRQSYLDEEADLNGDYTVGVACAGAGTLRFEMWTPNGGRLLGKVDVPCRYPAVRRDLHLRQQHRHGISLILQYDSTSVAPARVAWQYHRR
jgi:hypothetical protein